MHFQASKLDTVKSLQTSETESIGKHKNQGVRSPFAGFTSRIASILHLFNTPWIYAILIFNWLFPNPSMDDPPIEEDILVPPSILSQITNDYHLIGKYRTPLVLPKSLRDESALLEGAADDPSPASSASLDQGAAILRRAALHLAQKRQAFHSVGDKNATPTSPQDTVGPLHHANHYHYGIAIRDKYVDHDLDTSHTQNSPALSFPAIDSTDEEVEDFDDSLVINMETIMNPREYTAEKPSQYVRSVLDFYFLEPVKQHSAVDSLISSFKFDRVSTILDKEREAIQKSIADRNRRETLTAPAPLTKAQESRVKLVWSSSGNRQLVSKFEIDISEDDLRTLRPGRWLNDNIIDFYMNLVMEEIPNSYVWTTHFYTTLASKGYQGVARWAKRRKLNVFSKDIVIVPINIHNTHWAVAVVENKHSRIDYIDSLRGSGNMEALIHIRDYMVAEAKRLGISPAQEYTLNSNVEGPQQKNGFDCGVFTCMAAKLSAFGKPLQYSQTDMPVIRARMAYEILQKKLLT